LRRSLLRANPARDDLRKTQRACTHYASDRGIQELFAFTQR
jgi:hypothetical protein